MERENYNYSEQMRVDVIPHFERKRSTLLLDVAPQTATLAGLRSFAETEGLEEKTEFHITVIGRQTGEAILKRLSQISPEDREVLLTRLEDLMTCFSWSAELSSEFFLITKHYEKSSGGVDETRKSIIQTILLPQLDEFYDQLNSLLGTEFVTPFPHITLFSASTISENMLTGIGIYSKEQMESLNPVKIDSDT